MNCPNCRSANAKRCELLYAQSTSMSYGHEFSAFNISGMASRVAPPSPPIAPSYFRRRLLLLGVPGLLLCLLGVFFFLMLLANKGLTAAPGGLIPELLGGLSAVAGLAAGGRAERNKLPRRLSAIFGRPSPVQHTLGMPGLRAYLQAGSGPPKLSIGPLERVVGGPPCQDLSHPLHSEKQS